MAKSLHVVVAGATGLVGSALVDLLLHHAQIARVTTLVRRPSALVNPKLSEVIVADVDSLTESHLPATADAVFCCLGTTMASAGSRDAFMKVDYEYVLKLAVFTQRRGIEQFLVVSAAGANAQSRIFYNRVKGRMEGELMKLNKVSHIAIFRPSMLLGPRREQRTGESVAKVLMKTFSWLLPRSVKPIYAVEVAAAMLDRMLNPKGKFTLVDNASMLGLR